MVPEWEEPPPKLEKKKSEKPKEIEPIEESSPEVEIEKEDVVDADKMTVIG